MEFLKILFGRSRSFYLFLAILSIFNGLLNTGLLMFINKTITRTPLPFLPRYDWLLFLALVTVSLIVSKVFHTYMVSLTTDIRSDLQISILRKLKHANYQEFEKLGNEKVFTAMGDINMLSNLPEVFMNMMNALITVACCFVYLFLMSVTGAALIMLMMTGLLIFYLVRNRSVEKQLNLIRNMQNNFWKYLGDLLGGFRETKMRFTRNENIHTGFLEKNINESKALSIKASTRYLDNELTGNYSWYLTLGAIMFLLPRMFSLDQENVTAFLITILYLMGPVAVLITLVPTYTNVKIALQRLDEFNAKVKAHITQETTGAQTDDFGPFRSIRFEQVKFEYFDTREQRNFVLGPLSLEIKEHETVFIAGGNGSGKTTFAYLLTGLYRPSEGTIYLNNIPVTEDNRAVYRNRMSAIYTNGYLFGENYDGFDLNPEGERLAGLIALLKLNGILRMDDKHNMLDIHLSKGQQKRLALIYALLEENPFIMLDEWAAEQDPAFRHYFYEILLSNLKAEGKTIVAITHDDDFYHCCDRIIKFGYGKVLSDQRTDRTLSLQ
ncbi:cyclic peptide export ABC transporter [Chitinophaga sp. GbtcB8]|uniref:cyclic peptide export ABC transporter n=1 Tax=Chitinophaga sp. GbtcB8 TaxID=2824753 RepID=UPI001C2FF06D|nr:cyclic peptide export ABC transporter [Chitinophaga sp. GbtcB8]